MILGGFKRKNIKKRLEKNYKNSIENSCSSNAKVKSVIILVDESILDEMGQKICNELNLVHSNIEVITFKNTVEKGLPSRNAVSEKDFSLFGKFKNEEIQKILMSKVDLLVNYSSENQCLNSLAVISNALFKVGFLDKNTLIYDLMIDVGKNDFEVFNSELKKYLKILNKL